MRFWILFGFVVLITAVVLRHLLPGRLGLGFYSGGIVRGMPMNVFAFWLVLTIGSIVILAKLASQYVRK
jgi:uncharacterized membrane protein